MAIEIKKTGNLFTAKVTPPHGQGSRWQTTEPLELDELVKKLRALGCHPQDIGDVLYEIDPALIGAR